MGTVSGISGEFRDADLEAAFQADRLPESRRHARLLFLLAALLNMLFLFSDWRFAGTPHFWVAIPARTLVILASLAAWWMGRHMTSFKAVERICLAWQVVTAACVAVLVSSRSDIALFVLVMLPLIFYLAVPTSFRGNVGGGLGCGIALLIGYLAPAPQTPTTSGMVVAALMLHCGMWIALSRTNHLQRRAWLASRDARSARTALAANGEVLERLAMTDALTGLANRSHFMATLTQAAQSTERSGGRMAVVLIDVDEFKRINDSAGHHTGDALLCTIADRLRDTVRPTDLAARMGGDEFALILPRLRGMTDLDHVLNRMFANLHRPLHHNGRDMDCRVSMGVAIYPDHASDMADLMKHADIALYEAKNDGRGRACLFEPGLLESWQTEARMLERARDALTRTPPIPWYQPKVDLNDGRIIGFEALLRWQSPDGTLMMPDQILAAFEHPELGCKITERMIEQVLADCRQWLDEGLEFGHVAINVPGVELHDRSFPDRLLARLSTAGVEARRIELEVTESVFLGRHADVVERNLHRLSQAGMSIALDDFGTGYASLSHLKQFPIDVIKIDKGFVRDLETDPDDAAIVRAVLNLAYSLGIRTVAEGVENQEQLNYLRSGGCHYGQGFYFSPAVAAAQLPSFLATSRFAQRMG